MSAASQSDDVEPDDAAALPIEEHEWRYVLNDASVTTHHRHPTHAAELVHSNGSRDERPIRHRDVAALEGLVAEHPTFTLAHSALAAWCTRLERHDEAIGHARRACELEPNDPFSYTALSVACMRGGRIAEAEDALAKSRLLQGGH